MEKRNQVGEVWRVLDEDDREAALVLVVESYPTSYPWPSWADTAHRCELLWELAPGYGSWCLNSDEDGRLWMIDGDENVERVL